jgi:quinol monooxygenase YgiN
MTARRVVRAAVVAVAMLTTGAMTMTANDRAIARYGAVPSGAFAVVAEVRAKPGKERELRDATLPLVAAVRSEPNNLVYFLHEDRESPGRFVFYEIFASRADFDAHNATPHVQAWFARLPELASGGVTVVRMEILGNTAAVSR